MATLQVRGPEWSGTKQKALDDAKKMQVAVNEQSMRDGKELPPYMLTELIGKGSFGRVYKATDVKHKSLVAVKIIDIEESDTLNPKLADTFKEFMAEVNALKLLSDSGARNINHVIDALPVGQSMWMITEYCAGGSVATLMRPTAPGGLQERWIVPILREVAEAVFWVHRQGIIHRDIKCANVLITESGGVQLCDFGVAGVIETKFDKRSTFIGTPHWMAPELFDQNMSYGTEVDIWAFGSMVYEIASGLPPNVMAGIDVYQLGNYIKSHVPRLEGDQYSDQLKSLVAFCLMEDPRQRPTIEQVQAHPYIMNSAQRYPTSSLSLLVRGYKLWESQGGARKSLFAPGGAQGLADVSDLSSTALANDEWNFSTTLAFDQEVFEDPDGQAVFDVYGTNVDFDPSEMFRQNNSKPKGRRRPPPQALAAMRAPLEKVFDPNTISNYEDNARAYYGIPAPPPVSDLPLRDESSQSADVRESLIDLDASLNGVDLSRFVDMDTIRAGEPRMSVDYYGDPEDSEFNRPPLSDPADLNPNRRTQDWKFPSFGPASANPEMSKFPPSDALSVPSPANRPSLQHSSTDPVQAPNYGGPADFTFPRPGTQASMREGGPADFTFPRPGTQASMREGGSADFTFPRPGTQASMRESVSSLIDLDMSMPEPTPSSRESMSSLIDLDMSMPEPTPESTRPSTANSDAASVSGSEMGMANPFDLERHASLYIPSSNREPSIYVSDDSDFASAIPKANDAFANGLAGLAISESSRSGSAMSHHSRPNGSIGSSTGSSTMMMPPPPPLRVETGFNPTDYADEPEDSAYLTPQTSRGPFDGSTPTAPNTALNGRSRPSYPIPSAPAPPLLQVMQGQADPEMVKAELRRMTMSLGEHLTLINQHLSSLPVRDAGYDGSDGMQ